MTSYECGLVVGKFAPLHRGHQLVIDTALSRCGHVVLLTYSNPELPGCAPERREDWLAQLYPQTTRVVVTNDRLARWYPGEHRVMPSNGADDDAHRAFVTELLCRVVGKDVDAVFTSENYGEGFAAYLQRNLRSRGSARSIAHVKVDAARATVPISGIVIRKDVHAAREWMHPAVYASFVERVLCLGGESSGKSTLVEALAREFGTVHVPEYGRDLWIDKDGKLEFDDLLHIARTQLKREQMLLRQAKRYLFCDTSPRTTLFYSIEMFGRAAPELDALATRPYDRTILCAPDFDFVQDGTRRDPEFRIRQHEWYRQQLDRFGVPYFEVTGTNEARVRQVKHALSFGEASLIRG